jgi:hypothetical protein
MEAQPDFYFWVLSEGRISGGMPGYKSSLSEEKRWQTLTYMWQLSKAPPPVSPTPTKLPVEGVSLALTSPGQANTGQELTFSALLKDAQGKPVSGATVKYLFAEEFFARGQMVIGEAITNEQGVAAFNYTPTRAGETTLTAQYETIEKGNALSIMDSGEIFYQAETGIKMPSPGPEVFLGPESAHELGQMGEAPNSALRLPGGVLSWLWLFIGVLVLVWGVYFIIMYQVLRISGAGRVSSFDQRGTANTRLLPLLGLIAIFWLGLLMVLMVIDPFPFSRCRNAFGDKSANGENWRLSW